MRVIAGEEFCVEELQKQDGLSPEEARELIKKSDCTRRHFIARHFKDESDMSCTSIFVKRERFDSGFSAPQPTVNVRHG